MQSRDATWYSSICREVCIKDCQYSKHKAILKVLSTIESKDKLTECSRLSTNAFKYAMKPY